MGIPIRIDESIYYEAKKVASAEFRSISNQIEYWAKLGKCALDNPDLPIEFIKDVLLSKLQDKSLAEPFNFEEKVSDINVKQMPAFKKAYKKLPLSQQVIVNNAIKEIIKNPQIGNEKRGDLSGVFVYKFKIHHQEFLLAYEWDATQRLLLALGVHENFYRDLKNS